MSGYANYTNEELIRRHSGSDDPLTAELVERLVTAMVEITELRGDAPSCGDPRHEN